MRQCVNTVLKKVCYFHGRPIIRHIIEHEERCEIK